METFYCKTLTAAMVIQQWGVIAIRKTPYPHIRQSLSSPSKCERALRAKTKNEMCTRLLVSVCVKRTPN